MIALYMYENVLLFNVLLQRLMAKYFTGLFPTFAVNLMAHIHFGLFFEIIDSPHVFFTTSILWLLCIDSFIYRLLAMLWRLVHTVQACKIFPGIAFPPLSQIYGVCIFFRFFIEIISKTIIWLFLYNFDIVAALLFWTLVTVFSMIFYLVKPNWQT